MSLSHKPKFYHFGYRSNRVSFNINHVICVDLQKNKMTIICRRIDPVIFDYPTEEMAQDSYKHFKSFMDKA